MKTDSGKIGVQWFFGILAVVAFGMTVGCGGDKKAADPAVGMTEDQKAVDNLVGKVSDISGSLQALRAIFTKEASPSAATAAKYGKNMFSIIDDIVVTGDTATMNVEVCGYEENSQPTTKVWKAQKVDGEWKLSDAPV
ncbi:MAG: hypothetical protein GY768_06565 [Planctomycetaceae bacterium]|nr:hypothetical protein [Planctomycetaceae bacterium]